MLLPVPRNFSEGQSMDLQLVSERLKVPLVVVSISFPPLVLSMFSVSCSLEALLAFIARPSHAENFKEIFSKNDIKV